MNKNNLTKPSRDYTVELWRFIFCIVVLGLHFFAKTEYRFFRAGYLGVEFFFLLSGYGIYTYYIRKMQGKKFGEKWYLFGTYIGSRLIRLYPLYLISLLCMLAFRAVSKHWSFMDCISYFKRGWAEFLMLQCGPLGNEVLISPHWYVAAFFWGSIILLLVLMLTGRFGGYVLCPLASFFLYRYYFQLIGKIDVIYSYHAVLRAIAGLALGIFIGFLAQIFWEKWLEHAQEEKLRKTVRYVMFALANVLLAGVAVYTNFGRRSKIDFLVIGIFAISQLFLFSARVPVNEKKKALFARLSSVTYPVYLFQMPVIELLFWLLQ